MNIEVIAQNAIRIEEGNGKVIYFDPYNEYEFGGIKFKTIPAYNINKAFHKREVDVKILM